MLELKIVEDLQAVTPEELMECGETEVYFWYKGKKLTDNHGFGSPEDFLDYHSDATYDELEDLTISEKEVLVRKNHVLVPLYLLEHSGTKLSTTPFSCPWDSGQVGYVMMSHEEVIKNYGSLNDEVLENVHSWIKSYVEVWDDWMNGNVFGYVLEQDGVVLDSTFGFYGDIDKVKAEIEGYLPCEALELLADAKIDYGYWEAGAISTVGWYDDDDDDDDD